MKIQDFAKQRLSKKQMNQVKGSGAFFKCECIGPNNSPFIPEWDGYYRTTDEMQIDIGRRCQQGGRCDRYQLLIP